MIDQMLYPQQLPSAYEGRDLLADGLFTIDQAAEFLGVCRATIYNLMDDSQLPFIVIEHLRGRRIPKAALRIFAEISLETEMRRRQKRHIRGRGEGSVTLDKVKSLWQASIQTGLDENGKPVRRYVSSKNKEIVLEKLRALQDDKSSGLIASSGQVKLSQYLQSYLDDVIKANGRTTGTYHNYSGLVKNHINQVLGGYRIRDLEPRHLQHLQATLIEKGVSIGVRRKVHIFLSSALKKALRLRAISTNPCSAVDPPKVKAREMKVFDEEQAERFLESAATDRLYAMYVLALTCGLRQGELLGLKWGDIDLKSAKPALVVQRTLDNHCGKLVAKEPKTESSRRRIWLGPIAVAALKAHQRLMMAEGHRASEWVFCNSIGTPYHRINVVRRNFEPLIEKAEVPPIRFHDLRHTAATLMLNRGLNIKLVSSILGHKDVTVTLRTYAHVLPSMQEQAVAAMDGLFPTLKRSVS